MKSVFVWVNLRKVPLHMWNYKALSKIASVIRKPIMMDKLTAIRARMSFARVLIEIDVGCEYPASVPIFYEGKHVVDVDVEYPLKAPKCNAYNSLGHIDVKFPWVKPKEVVVEVPKKTNGAGNQQAWADASNSEHVSMEEGDFSPKCNKENVFIEEEINNDTSGRIWVGWNSREMSVKLIHFASQAIFLEVTTCRNLKFAITFIYGDNDSVRRVVLWKELLAFAGSYHLPWALLGDFNEILNSNERVGGSSSCHISTMNEFVHCVEDTRLFDLPFSGDFYTWSNKQIGTGRIVSEINRVLVNIKWGSVFTQSKVDFLAPGISDHCSMVIYVYERRIHGPPPFHFLNYLSDEPDF
ncbi:uncharacterized protein LOC113312638 [Papaver somniferum]|uniref:uncharacterized protein LOC113312638 n=1 Tax=Papaver somniferum TaxID=3469 RepID=UPI000E6FA934|nr:uncharacterized protein LOC113312638 [Papaver somniferum]